MTFTEAAAHVLRLVGKPLHYKEITDVAIERDLLSHVGKSPEVTMGARLAAVVKKDPKDNPLVRVKPGVFALRDWDQGVIDTGLADRTPALERLAKLDVNREDGASGEPPQTSLAPDAEESELETSNYPDLASLDGEDDEDIGDDERARAELAAAATELFVPEEDDDEPILGGDLETEAVERTPAGDAGGKRRRRRRRRGGRTGGDEDSGLPSYTVSDAPLLSPGGSDVDEDAPIGGAAVDSLRPTRMEPRESAGRGEGRAEGRSEARVDGRGEGREGGREGRERSESRPEARVDGRGEGREPRERAEGRERGEGRARGEGREGRERGNDFRPDPRPDIRNGDARAGDARGEGRSAEGRSAEGRGDARDNREERVESRGPEVGRGGDDLGVASMLTLLEQLLPPRSRTGAIPIRQLAEQGVRRVRAKVELQTLQDALADAVRSEVVRARSERRRPRFALHGRAIALTDWGMDGEVLRLEKELLAAATRHREAFQRSFGERLQSLPPRALSDLFSLLLNQIGFEDVQPVRRQGAHSAELHFSALSRAPSGDRPTAIILRRDGRDIGRERVIDLRGALHHYAGAQAGFLVTTGQVLSGAREEAAMPNAAPVSLLDGVAVSKLCAQHGVGVAWTELRVPMVDIELMDSLTPN